MNSFHNLTRSLFKLISLAILLSANCGTRCDATQSVSYKDFGAAGDGQTDDFKALLAAHEYANKTGQPVEAESGATYYLGGAAITIPIMTDTDFGTAEFIIDDTKLESHRHNIFEVRSAQTAAEVTSVKSLRKGQKRLNIKLPGPCLISVTNSKVNRFIRRGGNRNSGKAQTDVFLVDRHGQVDPDTPIIWDFDHITEMKALPLDEKPLTITGGRFTTIAHSEVSTQYHARGIAIRRSNVAIDGMEHRVTGEGENGPPYRGFINIADCANVQIRNSVFSGRKTYYKIGSAGRRVPMGSYDISINRALNVTLFNCTQFNDINDRSIWGIMGTNFCKNLVLDGCKLSRFDAHMGVTNARIKDSTLGYMGIKLTGFGTFLVENTTVRAPNFIDLRRDYGSTWNGKIIIRDCRLEPTRKRPTVSIISGSNDGQHDFGYTTYLPSRVVIDGFHFADDQQGQDYKGPTIFGNINPRMKDASYKMPHPQVITETVAYRGVTTERGKPLQLSENPFLFKDVTVHDEE